MKTGRNWLPPFLRSQNATKQIEAKMSAPIVAGSFLTLQSGLNADWTNPSYAALAQAGYMKNPIVHRCVRLICEAVGTLPMKVVSGDEEIIDHPLVRLLQKPNAHQSKREFFEMVCGHLLLSGEAFIEQISLDDDELPSKLYALRPDCITCIQDEFGWPAQYKISGKKDRVVDADEQGVISRILHIGLFHPLDDQGGFAPLIAARMALDTHNAAASWNKALLDNAARPSGALVYAPGDGSNLTPEQFDNLKRELEEGYAGAKNAGKPMLLEGGLDWKSMGLSPKDMDFMEMKNGASRDIALAFGVPPMILGIPGDNTYANYQEANRAFFRLTVVPMMSRLVEAMHDWLVPALDDDISIQLNLDQVDGLAQERDLIWQRIENASFLTDDEKRKAVGYPAKQGS